MKISKKRLRQLIESVLLEDNFNGYDLVTQYEGTEYVDIPSGKFVNQPANLRAEVISKINNSKAGVVLKHFSSQSGGDATVSNYSNMYAIEGEDLLRYINKKAGGRLGDNGEITGITDAGLKSAGVKSINIAGSSVIQIWAGKSRSEMENYVHKEEYVKILQDPYIRSAIQNRVNASVNGESSSVVLSFIDETVEKIEGYKTYKYRDLKSSRKAIMRHLDKRLKITLKTGEVTEIEFGGYIGVGIQVDDHGTVAIHVPE